MNTIYEVANYLVNISDYKTKNIQDTARVHQHIRACKEHTCFLHAFP